MTYFREHEENYRA